MQGYLGEVSQVLKISSLLFGKASVAGHGQTHFAPTFFPEGEDDVSKIEILKNGTIGKG